MSYPRFFSPTIEQIKQARADYAGFCRACGAEQFGVEPDAERYECEACGEFTVYGAEEFLMNEWISEPSARLAVRATQTPAAKPAPVAPAAGVDKP